MSIQVKNICKRFGDFTALDDININFPTGELVALLGPSGCGKTSLLRIIAGLDIPDSGEVWLDGRDCSNIHVKQREVGFVFQHYALFKHMNVFENVAFGLKIKPFDIRLSNTQITKKVNELLKLVQLDWLGDRFPSQLSGGQRQRIALARALAVEPKVLLLDEPFGALDAKVRQDLRRWLRRLHDELHITSLFVTHDQQEALEVADHIVLMNNGKVIQMGSPQSLYEKPQSAFVYEFLGGTNTFEGVVDGEYIKIGPYLLPHYHETLVYGQNIKALSRPHEIDIKIFDENNKTYGIVTKIKRIHYVGGLIQLELVEELTKQIYYCETHVHSEQVAKQFAIDMLVTITPSKIHIF